MKTDEIKIKSPPEQEEPTVKEDENLPPVIIINKGKFSLQKVIRKLPALFHPNIHCSGRVLIFACCH